MFNEYPASVSSFSIAFLKVLTLVQGNRHLLDSPFPFGFLWFLNWPSKSMGNPTIGDARR